MYSDMCCLFFFYTVYKQGNKCIVCDAALLSKTFCFHPLPFAYCDASVTFVLLNRDITGNG